MSGQYELIKTKKITEEISVEAKITEERDNRNIYLKLFKGGKSQQHQNEKSY